MEIQATKDISPELAWSLSRMKRDETADAVKSDDIILQTDSESANIILLLLEHL
jgi:hypothetical protein